MPKNFVKPYSQKDEYAETFFPNKKQKIIQNEELGEVITKIKEYLGPEINLPTRRINNFPDISQISANYTITANIQELSLQSNTTILTIKLHSTDRKFFEKFKNLVEILSKIYQRSDELSKRYHTLSEYGACARLSEFSLRLDHKLINNFSKEMISRIDALSNQNYNMEV